MLDHGLARLVGLLGVPLAHHLFGIEKVNGEFDENGTGHAPLATLEGLFQGWHHLAQGVGTGDPFDVWLHQRHLVDVLKRTATTQHGGGGAADQHHGRLCHLGIFDGGDGVADARPSGDDGDPRNAGEA